MSKVRDMFVQHMLLVSDASQLETCWFDGECLEKPTGLVIDIRRDGVAIMPTCNIHHHFGSFIKFPLKADRPMAQDEILAAKAVNYSTDGLMSWNAAWVMCTTISDEKVRSDLLAYLNLSRMTQIYEKSDNERRYKNLCDRYDVPACYGNPDEHGMEDA